MSDGEGATPDGDDAPATGDTPADEPEDGDPGVSTRRDVERYVRYLLLAGLTLLALVALLRFYVAASNAIDTWVAREYRPLFQAAFNLVVLLLAGIGVSRQVRALR